jgi:hypothetical protein
MTLFYDLHIFLMIKLQLSNAAIIYDTDWMTSQLFRKSFNCRYIPRMDYAFCLFTLKSYEKWRSPLFGATCNFNDQILPYGILFLTFINTNVFYLLSFKFSRYLLRSWRFPLMEIFLIKKKGKKKNQYGRQGHP